MEKEEKGLFVRLMEAWKERLETAAEGGIGFWTDGKDMEELEENGEARESRSLSREKEKQTFWRETAQRNRAEKEREGRIFSGEKEVFFAEEGKKKDGPLLTEKEERDLRQRAEMDERAQTGKRNTSFFMAEIFRRERMAEERESRTGGTFLWETPEEEGEKRRILPMAEEREQKRAAPLGEGREPPEEKTMEREEKQAEPPLDIEMLMAQITKRLWEERESCGRRLRG